MRADREPSRTHGRQDRSEYESDRGGLMILQLAPATHPSVLPAQRSRTWSVGCGRCSRRASRCGEGAVANLTPVAIPVRCLGGAPGHLSSTYSRWASSTLTGCRGWLLRGVRGIGICMTPTRPASSWLTDRLREFWARVGTGADRLWLLREAAEWRVDEVRSYRARRSGSWRKASAKGPCWACAERPAVHRHHIVQIQHGGRNVDKNLVGLCRRCHGRVHPWMRRRRRQLGVLAQPIQDARPRLVKRGTSIEA